MSSERPFMRVCSLVTPSVTICKKGREKGRQAAHTSIHFNQRDKGVEGEIAFYAIPRVHKGISRGLHQYKDESRNCIEPSVLLQTEFDLDPTHDPAMHLPIRYSSWSVSLRFQIISIWASIHFGQTKTRNLYDRFPLWSPAYTFLGFSTGITLWVTLQWARLLGFWLIDTTWRTTAP